MRRFQQWQDNQVYFIHLNNLTSIKNRRPANYKQPKVKSKTRIESIGHRRQRSRSVDQNENKIVFRSIKTSFKPRRIKDKGKLEQKNLVYENLLLGKRIMETPSIVGTEQTGVYSEKLLGVQHSLDGKVLSYGFIKEGLKHLRNLESEFKYARGNGKHVLKLTITGMQCDQLKGRAEEDLNLSIIAKVGKSYRSSELVSISQFTSHEFLLRFSRRLASSNVTVFVRSHCGNSDLELAQFSFRIPENLQPAPIEQVAKLSRKCGVNVGSVTYVFSVCQGINDYDHL